MPKLPQNVKLKEPVMFQRKYRQQDDFGQEADTWRAAFPARVQIEPLRGNQRVFAQQVQEETTHTITARYQPEINSQLRIRHDDGRIFNLKYVLDVDEKHVWMEIGATLA